MERDSPTAGSAIESDTRHTTYRRGLSPLTGCLLAVGLAALPAVLLQAVGILAVQGEIVVGRGDLEETRVWFVDEGRSQGLGLSSSGPTSDDGDGSFACTETQVRFLLWRSDGSLTATTYCECFERLGGQWQLRGLCP